MKIALIYHEKLREYDFGSGHPFRGDRFTDFMRLFKELKLHEDPTFDIVEPKPADDRDLLLVHDSGYISLLKRMNEKGGMLTLDTPMHPGIFEAAKLLVGSSLTAADLVGKGTYVKGVAIGGGLHHAARDRGGGFCLLNDVAISVAHLLRKYSLKRVLILDTDAHAGDGTSEIFYGDPRVLFISMHQDPLTLYPGVGFVDEIGTGDGTGYNVNVPLPPMASDSSFKHVFSEIVDPLASEFKPEVVFRNGGSDPHFADGLTNLGLT
ncbi:MAG: histone deacetylase family protein, partial [Candidatus Bathyarchaeia archaeon]